MRRIALALCLLVALGCNKKTPEATANTPSTSATTVSNTNPDTKANNPVTPSSVVATEDWPARPQEVFAEARVEGVMPTASAVLKQAAALGAPPGLDTMLPQLLAPMLGLSDATALNLSQPAGAMWLNLPQNESAWLVYVGVSSEEGFRKAFTLTTPQSDAMGNAMAAEITTSGPLSGGRVFVNFLNNYAVFTPDATAFATQKSYLEAIFARETKSPTLWGTLRIGKIWEKYGALAQMGMSSALKNAPPNPSGVDLEKMMTGYLSAIGEVDTLTLRHRPSADAYNVTMEIRPKAGSSWEKLLNTPSPTATLDSKLPLGWVSGVMSMSPETLTTFMNFYKTIFPTMGQAMEMWGKLSSQMTGEFAFSTAPNGAYSFVYLMGVKDEKLVQKTIQEFFVKEGSYNVGAATMEMSAIATASETIAGNSIDSIRMKYTLKEGTPEASVEAIKKMGLEDTTLRYAYLPGLVVMGIGDGAKPLLEEVLAGKSKGFASDDAYTKASASLPSGRLGTVFVSIPMALKSFANMLPPEAQEKLSKLESRSGFALGWLVENDQLRMDVSVPMAHILELKEAFSK